MKLLIKGILMIIQIICCKILKQEKNYLETPDTILSKMEIESLSWFWHTITSIVFTLFFSIKILPLISEDYAKELTENSIIIPITIIFILIPALIINGIIIEKYLYNKYSDYKIFVQKKG